MDTGSLLWFAIAVFILGISIIPLRLYVQDHDKRKLMYFLGLALSTVTFFILGFGYDDESFPNRIIQVFYLWGGIVYIVFLFHMTLERLLSNKINIAYLFYSFILNLCISLVVLFSGIVTQEVYTFFMFMATIFIFAFCITLIVKYKDTMSILFLFSLFTTFISSMMLSQASNNIIAKYFSIYSYFISYVLLATIFLFSTRKTSSNLGVGSYFSLERKLEETTKVLSETKDTFRTLFNEMVDAVAIVDEKGTLLEASNRFFDEINTTKDEIIGKNFMNTSFFDEATKKILMKNMVLRLEGKQITPYEIVLRRKDGSTLPYEIHAGKVQYNGKTADMVIFRNLTERKKTEENLIQYKNAVDQSAEGIALSDMEGNIQFVNNAWADMHGYSVDELIGRHLSVFHTKEQLEKEIIPFNKKAFTSVSNKGEVGHLHKDGTTFPTYMISTVLKGPDGKPFGMLGIANDITKRKQAEEALRESEERYRINFEQSFDSIMTLAPPSWKFTSGNPATVKLFGANSADDFIKLGPWDVSPEYQPDGQLSSEKSKEMIEKAMKEGSNFFDWTHRHLDGTDFQTTVLLSKMQLSGETYLQAVVRDISEQKKIGEALNRSEKEKSLILNSTKELCIYYTVNLEIVWANKAASEAFGKKSSELKGVSCHSLFFNTDAPCNNCPLLKVLESGKPEETELETPDGRYWFIRGYPVFDENHTITNLIEFALEITERKKAEDEIRYLKDYNENILESNPNPILVVKGTQIEYVNKSFIFAFGETKNEYIARNLKDIIPSEVLPVFENLLQEDGGSKELKFRGKDFNVHSFVVKKAEEEEEEEEEEARRGMVLQDITERKKAEKELKEKIEELERYKKITVDRELKMIELKTEMNKLHEKLGEKPRYNVTEEMKI